MFCLPFESMYIKVKSLLKYLLLPSWRRSYLLAKYIRDGLTAQEAMSLLGVVEAQSKGAYYRKPQIGIELSEQTEGSSLGESYICHYSYHQLKARVPRPV